jgi:uncharacterized protein YceK
MTCNAVLPTMAVLLACSSAVTHASPQAGYLNYAGESAPAHHPETHPERSCSRDHCAQ